MRLCKCLAVRHGKKTTGEGCAGGFAKLRAFGVIPRLVSHSTRGVAIVSRRGRRNQVFLLGLGGLDWCSCLEELLHGQG